MQKFLRLVFASGLISLFAVSAHAQKDYIINATGISALPSSVFPGQSSTISVSIVNGGAVSGVNDIPIGTTATASVLFTNTSSGSEFTLTGTAVTGTLITGKGGSGLMTFTASIPTQTTEAGFYRATVTLTLPSGGLPSGGSIGTRAASVSTTVLAVTGTPDLKLTALSYTAGTSFSGGDVISMSITYTNLNRSPGSGNDNVAWVPSGSGKASLFRIQIVLSSNPFYGDADDFQLTFTDRKTKLNAGSSGAFTWDQLIPGNFSGSYYVLAKIDSLDGTTETTESDPTQNGNNIWLDVNAPRISIQPTNFPTNYLASTTGTASGNGYSDNPSTSSDGRYTVFASNASNLVSGDTNGARDIFLFDNQTYTTRRLNLSRQGEQTNGPSNRPVISADGRYVAFESTATNLILGDTNGFSDIFVVEVITGAIGMLSLDASGTQANNANFRPSINSTGRFVSFESTATNLVGSVTTVGVSHIYVRDRDVSGSETFDSTGNTSTVLVSQSTGGTAANGNSLQSVLSADGRYITFASDATNLVSSDTNALRDIFLRDRTGGTTTLVSVATGGTQATGGDSRTPSLSSDGRYIAFASSATNLVSGDTNEVSDIYVHDRTTTTTQRISVSTSGTQAADPSAANFKLGSINPSISSTGRYVAFASLANNLTAGDIAGQKQLLDANDALDVFVRDRDVSASGTYDTSGNVATTMVSVNKFGLQTFSTFNTQGTASSDIFPSISADGRWVAFPSDAENVSGLSHTVTNLISIDNNNTRDVFLFDRVTNALPNPSIAPSVTITSPGTATSILVNTTTPITVSATTTVGVVSTVQFFVNGTSLGTSRVFPYTQTWTPTAAGNYVLSALVTDSFGNRGVSSNVTVTVKASPSVGVTSPVSGSSMTTGTTQTVTAVAAASNPGATITSVQFLANGISLGTSFTSPYSVAWTPASAGTYNLTAIATDSIGTQATSASVAITVTAAGGGGLIAPVVVIDTPADGSTLTVNIPQTISATASLSNGTVTSVVFSANGTRIGSATVYPYTINWTPASLGIFTITAVATGSNGAQATAVNTIMVNSATAPTVSITAPSTGSTVGVNLAQTITATAASSTGSITSVEFFVNGKTLSTDTVFPYTASWTPSGPGTYILTAVAKDNAGVSGTSTAISVSVTSNDAIAPVVVIDTPADGSTLTVNIPQTISATASLSNGTVTSVVFSANGTRIGSATVYPYTINWTPATLGIFTITAVATGSNGAQATALNTIMVNSATAPTVSITAPSTGSTVGVNLAQTITATAASSTGSITSVEFFVNGKTLSTDTVFPYTAPWTPSGPGTYILTAVAKDSSGVLTTSALVTITVAASDAPTVSITSPSPGSTVGVNLLQTITATAASSTGYITSVEFLVNGITLSTDINFPYTALWRPTSTGTYILTAVAKDNSGVLTTSTPVTITVAASAAPTVSLTNPASGSSYTIGSSLTLTATADDSDGNIVRVSFYVNDVLFSTDLTAPYNSIIWTPASSGNYTLTAQAADNSGNITTSTAITVTIGSNAAPTVSITSPATGLNYSLGNNVLIGGAASDTDGFIASVQFYANGQLIGAKTAAPYTFSWKPASAGTFALTAVATDNIGSSTTSAAVSVTVTSATAPTVSLTNPATGASYGVGTSIPLNAAVTGGNGPTAQVEFFINGASLSIDSSAPYNTLWTPASAGIYSLIAVATDNAGVSGTSTAISVSVTANAAPTVSITSPATGLNYSLGNNVLIGAAASDTDGFIASMQFFANGQLIGAKTAAPYTFSWKPSSAGTFALTAVATDNIGSSTTSAAVSVTVTSATAPFVSLTNPATGASYGVGTSILLNAAVTAGNGPAAQVEFFINGAPLSIVSSAPYNTFWTPASAGTYSLIAVATDNAGVSGTSTAISVSVTANAAPTARLISPGTDLVVGLGTAVNLSADASDADGSIASVRFLSNGTALAIVTSSPYRTTYTPSAAGIYTLIARAIDNSGNVTDSVAQTLTVLGGNAPVVSLVNPSPYTNITADSSLLLSATATDSGSIRRVEFYAGSTLLTTKSTQPYSYVWRPASIGTYAIRAVAYDANGTGISSSVSDVSVTTAAANAGALYTNITNPTTGTTVAAFRNINLSAVTNIGSASAPAMDFYANGYLLKTVTSAPFEYTFNVSVPGNYEFYAVARGSSSVYTSAPVAVTVLANAAPAVTLTAPATGSTINLSNSVTIKANASDPDDQIDTVKFLVNGQVLSTSSAYPYTATWKPTAEGIYTLTAIVKDSQGSEGGNQTISNPIYIRVAAPTSSNGTANYGADSIYAGTYAGGSENGKFTAINIGGRNAAYIGYNATGAAKTYLYNGLTVDSSGSFSSSAAITGRFNDTGISGTLDSSRLSYIGPVIFATGTTFASGYYTGNLAGRSASTLAAIVGPDGSITAYLADGSYTDAGSSTLDSTGAFDFRLAGGSRITGKADPSTGFLTGTLIGGPSGTFTGALVSGSTFSDGALRNLSTRGQVGTGSNILIAGFVVGGSSPKQILVRAIGPTLSGFGITGALADSQLELLKGTTRVALNDNWAGNTAIASASATVGAFPLPANSLDAVVLTQLDPGAYTAQVSGVGGRTGVALVELYDVDSVAAFAPQKLINVATRGVAGTGENQLIAGFVVTGTTTKKVLIRGVGPTLTSLGVTGALVDPVLQLIQTKGSTLTVVRENDNWETGNDAALITAATTKAGAFPLTSGSKDAVLLLNLPPGTYNATVTGVDATTGVVLVEVYEVP